MYSPKTDSIAEVKVYLKINTVDYRYLKYSVSRTFWYLEQMSWSLGKQLRQATARYLELLISGTVFWSP